MSNYMDKYLDWLESTTPEERLSRSCERAGGPPVDAPDPDWLYDSDGNPVEYRPYP